MDMSSNKTETMNDRKRLNPSLGARKIRCTEDLPVKIEQVLSRTEKDTFQMI
jgi:hypothetical protein